MPFTFTAVKVNGIIFWEDFVSPERKMRSLSKYSTMQENAEKFGKVCGGGYLCDQTNEVHNMNASDIFNRSAAGAEYDMCEILRDMMQPTIDALAQNFKTRSLHICTYEKALSILTSTAAETPHSNHGEMVSSSEQSSCSGPGTRSRRL